jgi:hypothetical protein
VPPPAFLTAQPEAPHRWLAVLAIGVGVAVGAAGFQSRALWLPRFMAVVRPAPVGPPSMGLNTLDTDGQLQIRWNRDSPPVQSAVDAVLEITDGSQSPAIQMMDRLHLQAGVFTYARQSERVEVRLIVHLPDRRDVREVTTFLGKLPEPKPVAEDPEVRVQRDELARQSEKLRSDLDAQAERTKKLEKSLSDVQRTLKQQQLQRLRNQAPPK